MSELDAATRAWVEEKHPPSRELTPEQYAAASEAINEAAARGNGLEAVSDQSALFEDDQRLAPTVLAERFVAPPFSVLDTRQGYWQARRQAWLSLGIRSEEGRGENLLGFSDTVAIRRGGTLAGKANLQGGGGGSYVSESSIFDPVLCELAYRWFCPPGGRVLDPFAGGSVRGVVAGVLGRPYLGIELRAVQVEANRAQGAQIFGGQTTFASPTATPRWVEGDSSEVLPRVSGAPVDLVFTCPPYADLEVYSDDPRDLSVMGYEAFREAYGRIFALALERLADDRFAAVVIGDVREKRTGNFRGLVYETVRAFEACGCRLYNQAVLINAVGSAPQRAARIFNGGRKLVPLHQHFLVFVKGDPARAAEGLEEA